MYDASGYGKYIKKRYGITEDDYERLLVAQGGKCGCCGGDSPNNRRNERRGKWHIDHCHATGKVRGLLCMNCNAGLGHFKDDVARLAKAITYLTARDTND